MEPKIKILLAYLLFPIGVIIAFVTNKDPKSDVVTFHLRQVIGNFVLSIVIAILSSVLAFPLAKISPMLAFLPSLLYLVILVNWVMGLIAGINEQSKPMPILGKQFDSWFSFIN